MGASEFHSRTVRGKNENYLSASVQVVIAVKVEPSEERVTLVGCLSLSTEIATLPHTALPNRFKRASSRIWRQSRTNRSTTDCAAIWNERAEDGKPRTRESDAVEYSPQQVATLLTFRSTSSPILIRRNAGVYSRHPEAPPGREARFVIKGNLDLILNCMFMQTYTRPCSL